MRLCCYAGGGIPKDFPKKHIVIFDTKYRLLPEGTPQRGRTSVKGKYRERELRPEGTPVNDWWTDIKLIHSPTDEERKGNSSEKWQD